jgi:outer membrane lipase/esterase
MRKAHLLAATALLGLATAHTARAGSLYAFGDSLSDNGNLYKLINYPPPPYFEGRFSNGPVWVEYLPGLAGLSFAPSQDYAYGGAFTGNLIIDGTNYGTNLVAPSVPGINTEIADFAAAGGRFSNTDVVTLWGGANNYFQYATVVEANPSQAVSLVTSGVATTITQLTADTNSLISLGARTLIVPNLPNLGSTPDYNTSALGTELGDAFSTLHDQYLPVQMATLHSTTGANIIVLNTQRLLENVIANPSFYGFSNVTDACIDATACVTGNTATQNSYLFWDGVHPTTHAQQIIAEYAAASLHGFESLSVPARLGTTDAQLFSTVLSNRMEALRAAGTGFTYNIPSSSFATPTDTGTDPTQKLSIFITGAGNFGSWDNSGINLGYHGASSAFAVGADYAFAPNIHAGLAVGLTNGNANVNDGGTVGNSSANFGLYGLATQGQFYEEASFGYGTNWYTIKNPAVFGADTLGKPGGPSYSASLFGGYVFPLCHGFSLTPSAGLDYTSTALGSYTEAGDPLLTQTVSDQGYEQLLGQTGVEAATSTLLGETRIATYVSIGMQARLTGNNGNFTSTFTDEPLVPLTTTYPKEPAAWALLGAGASASITSHLSASAALEATTFKSNGNDVAISGSLAWSF